MKIKNTFTGLTNIVDTGRFAFFIDIDENGVNLDVKDLVKQASYFSRVVLIGDEPFTEKEEIRKFIKSVSTINPSVKFEIHTKGTIHPLGIGNFNNIIYNVFVQLKKTGIKYDKRIKNDILFWFNDMKANFIFNIEDDNDIDEAFSIIADLSISKSQVFLMSSNESDFVIKQCKYFGYNFTALLEV